MSTFEFELVFTLPEGEQNPEDHLDALYEAGCSDAFVGVGKMGSIGLQFTRESLTLEKAVESAISNVKKAIPEAKLIKTSYET